MTSNFDHMAYVEAQLQVTHQRVVTAAAAFESQEREAQWLEACAERESELETPTGDAPSTWLRSRLCLTPTEERVLWILLAHEMWGHTRVALRELATESENDVTCDVLRKVVYGTRPDPRAFRELSASGTLRRHILIERVDSTSRIPDHRMTFRVSGRVLGLVHDTLDVDDELHGIVDFTHSVSSSELVLAPGIRDRTRAAMARVDGLTMLHGSVGGGRRSLLQAVAGELGMCLMSVDARRISVDRAIAERQLRLIARDARLLDRVPMFLELDALATSGEVTDRLGLFEECCEGRVVATTVRPLARRWRRPPMVIEVPRLKGDERARAWQQNLPAASEADAQLLATMYPLSPALIASVAKVASVEACAEEMMPDHIEAGLRSVLDDRLAGLATRVEITQKWEDLVLPDEQTLAVVELLARIRERRRVYEEWGFADKLGKGLGVTALFAGPPGTGKSMCAGLIAKDLGTELYQVDLGKIVSKWIGETEKNLAALFDAAESGHAVLLFDEADSLFGKRTAVQTSNDRHANQETNYLLQRLETFNGICILTTNHESAIDEAFRRRLSVYVRFPLPDEEEREKLWQALLPGSAPVDPNIQFSVLAKKFVMSGGHIRNAVLRAAFLAADAAQPIGAYHLTQAAQIEYETIGKLIAQSV